MAVSGSEKQVGGDSVEKATGKPRETWRALLDAAGAAEWPHPAIASWLVSEHGVDGWWAQNVTVDYEQYTGRRKPGQRANGSFEVGTTRTLPLEQRPAFDALIASVTDALGEDPFSVNTGGKYFSSRWKFDDGRALLGSAQPTKNGKTSVGLTMTGILDESDLTQTKATLKDWLPEHS